MSYGGFVQAFEDAQVAISLRSRWGHNLWPMRELVTNQAKIHMDICHDWLAPLIQRALDKKENMKKEPETEIQSLLDHLVRTTDGMLAFKLLLRLCLQTTFFRSRHYSR